MSGGAWVHWRVGAILLMMGLKIEVKIYYITNLLKRKKLKKSQTCALIII